VEEAKVGIIGLGYVGLPLAVEFAKAGFARYRLRRRPIEDRQSERWKSYIPDVPSEELAAVVKAGTFPRDDGSA
jgi:UDP-N-acetyl-D-mannosaminuronate dehydrogenase